MARQSRILAGAALSAALLWTAPVHADILTVWAAAKTDYVSGTGDMYKAFDQSVGFGAEGGVEILGLDLFGEALIMGEEQFLLTANLGIDLSFGDDMRFSVGAFTGPIFFIFPEGEGGGGLNLGGLPADQRAALESATGRTSAQLEEDFNQYADQQGDLERLAVGWNLGRARVNLEYKLIPLVYVGVSGQVAYHYILSGEDVAAGAKNEAINKYTADKITDEQLRAESRAILRNAVGAEEIDTDSLAGMNYHFGVFLKLEL